MQESEEFKLKVIKKIYDEFNEGGVQPGIYFKTAEGKNKSFKIPTNMFTSAEYKEILPSLFKNLLKKAGARHYAMALICMVTEFKIDDPQFVEKLEKTDIGKKLLVKLEAYDNENEDLSFSEEERDYLAKELSEEKLVILFEHKDEKHNSLMAFTRENGKLKSSEHFDDTPMDGLFCNLLKY